MSITACLSHRKLDTKSRKSPCGKKRERLSESHLQPLQKRHKQTYKINSKRKNKGVIKTMSQMSSKCIYFFHKTIE